MNFRNLVLHNLGWKIFSIALALLTWFLIHFDTNLKAQITPPGDSFKLELPSVQIGVRTRPDDTNRYEFRPATAYLVFSGSQDILEKIEKDPSENIDAYLDLANINFDEPRQIAVRVRHPDGVSLVSVVPSHLMVKRVTPKPTDHKSE